MNFNLVEMYNGLLRFNKHILNELGNYNADGSNLSTYPAVYRGILNFFGDILTFVRDVAIINRNANYNSVYLLKKRS
jgi:hypothetical protein